MNDSRLLLGDGPFTTELLPQFSPDGRWVAYQSDEEGQWEVFVDAVPDWSNANGKSRLMGGLHPCWSQANGR